MLADSMLFRDFQQHAVSPTGQVMCIYGNHAYPLAANTVQKCSFNTTNAGLLYIYESSTSYFKFIDFKKNLRIGLNCVGKMYIIYAILRTLKCLYGNTTAEFFT